MSFLSIKDAPLKTTIVGDEKIPTGGYGDLAITTQQIKDFTALSFSNVDNTSDLDKPVSNATQAALNLKANITYVDNALALKSDKTYLDDQLALKASKIYVDTELQKTASKTYVDNQLATKSSTTYVDNINATKANISYVDSGLALKSDITYVDDQLTLKADKATTLSGYGIADAYTKTQVDASVTAVAGGHKAYTTLALAQAAQASLPANTIVEVTNDGANNGTYQWNGTTLTKSVYDPLTQAKEYTDTNFNKGRSTLVTDISLLTYQQNGSYFGPININLPDAPVGRDATKEFILEVASIIDSNRFKIQKYTETVTGKIWVRTIDTQNNSVRKDWAISVVDDASITAAKIANKAVSRLKLSDTFLFNEVLTSGLISDARKDGVYFGTAQNHTDIPSSGLSPANNFILEVKDLTGVGRYIYQKISRYSAFDREWWRVVDTTNPTAAVWTRQYVLVDSSVTTSMLVDASVTGAKLASSYRYKAMISTGSTRDVVNDGNYLIVATTTADNPPQITGNYILVVENISSGSYVQQTAIQITDGSKISRRTIRPANNVFYDWKIPDSGQVNPFFGKKIAFLGDSITEFGNYPSEVGSALGLTVLNLGLGGTRMSYHELEGYGGLSGYKLADAIATGVYTDIIAAAEYLKVNAGDDNTAIVNLIAATDWSTVDYLVVGYGTNDFNGVRPIGTLNDKTSDGSTFYGSINYFIETILTAHQQLKIILTTPIWRARTKSDPDGLNPLGSDATDNTIGLFVKDYAEAIKNSANKYHIECLDLHSKSGINHLTAAKYIGDGVHPTVDGYSLLAKKLSGFLRATF